MFNNKYSHENERRQQILSQNDGMDDGEGRVGELVTIMSWTT